MRKIMCAVTWLLAGFAGITACTDIADAPDNPTRVSANTTPVVITITPSFEAIETASPLATAVSERFMPVVRSTVPAEFIIVTPTAPPSKTPSVAPTITPSPTLTNTSLPILQPSSTAVAEVFPTIGPLPTIVPVIAAGITVTCSETWAFSAPLLGCPAGSATAHFGVYQSFEKSGYASYMLWIAPKTIYVLYGDGAYPHWREFEDIYVEGLDPAYEPGLDYSPEFAPERPSMNHWQPRRGFGRLWRDNVTPLDIMARIGWADIPWEIPYTMVVQHGTDGMLFMSDPYGNILALMPNGGRWSLISAVTSINPMLPSILPPPQPPN